MKKTKAAFLVLAALAAAAGGSAMEEVKKTNDQWKKELTPEQFHVCRLGGTEAPFTGEYVDNHEQGVYRCVACGNVLFRSDEKFESGSGWPSFYDVAQKGTVRLSLDDSHNMKRTEVTCAKCGAHLGHLFDDAPKTPTGQRYCINSVSLKFEKSDGQAGVDNSTPAQI